MVASISIKLTTNGHRHISSPPHSPIAVSVSPTSPSNLHSMFRQQSLLAPAQGNNVRQPRVLHPFAAEGLRLLLLENISQDAVKVFEGHDFKVDQFPKAWSEDELVEKIGQYHAIGIRSKTKITERVLKAATRLLVIGCFCIGTNQVDLDTAAKAGIPVFNSPFSNSRSVAELVLAEIVALSRQLCDRSAELHNGIWNKVSKGCWEIRGKTLGIVGYGHIGAQLSVLAESFGMRVIFYDVVPIMPLGSARQVDSLKVLLEQADFVTLHVPELTETTGMISKEQLGWMKNGSYLINNARGKVVDIPALIEAVKSKRLAGAALDVYPSEPGSNGPGFDDKLNPWATALRSLPNIILTPHIGGSTEEAQQMIGEEVSSALSRYLLFGASVGAVNFPEVDLRAITADQSNFVRVCHVHHNQPGVLKKVNEILAAHNVEKQFVDSKGSIAYLMADIADVTPEDIKDINERINATKWNILTRLLA